MAVCGRMPLMGARSPGAEGIQSQKEVHVKECRAPQASGGGR